MLIALYSNCCKNILPDSQEIWLHTQTIMADGTVSEAKQRLILDEPSKVSILAPAKVVLLHTITDINCQSRGCKNNYHCNGNRPDK